MSQDDIQVDEAGGVTDPPPPPAELTPEARKKLAELDEALAKFETQKRWSDVAKTILAKADLVVDSSEKIALYAQAGALYLERLANQAEAIKAYEQVLEHDARNIEAITRLREMYEKRRDWERLVRVMRLETEMLDPDDRALRYVEMAQLATERLRKPEICIELWQLVLDTDQENPQALANLAGLYERAREWGQLARVLDIQSTQITDPKELSALLVKLGMIYADKLNDDAGAVSAFQRLLELDPNDRRAQEQLKKRYVALKAWDDLEAFYATQDKWDELIRTLEREAETAEVPAEQRIDLLFRVARLWAERKEKPDRAAKSYEKILEIDPQNLDAAVALSPIYEGAGDAKKLVGVYEVRLKHVEDPEEKLVLLRESGILYEERLKDPASAFERFLEAFAIDPARDVPRDDAERVAAQVNGWDRVIAAYTDAIDRLTNPDDQDGLRVHLGRVLTEVGRVEEAIAQFKAVYEARGDHAESIAALEALYRQTGRFSELMEIIQRRAELEADPEERRRLAYDLAALWETELKDPERAIDAFTGILAEYGDTESAAYEALERLYEGLGRWSDLVSTLERRIDLGPSSDEELCALKFRTARVLEQHAGEKERAVELYREILTIMPDHDGARGALEVLIADRELGVTAAQILEPIYEMRGEWESLIAAIEVLLAGAQEAEVRLEYLTKIGEVAQVRLENAARAFEAFSRALAEQPSSVETLERLESIAAAHDGWKDLVGLVSNLAAGAKDADLARSLWIKAAQLQEARLGDVDAAVAAYMRVLDADPSDAEVLGALEALYRRTERWRDLLGVMRKRTELSGDPAETEELLAQMAAIHEEMLQQPAESISLYREILSLDPGSERALAALDSLFERQEMWSDLADNIGGQLAVASDPLRQIELMLRLADLRERRMGAAEAAVEIYREVLERDPGNEAALAALERLLRENAHQLVVAEILEPIYRDSNEFQKLVGVHEIQVQHATSAERRVELLHKIAELYELAIDDLPSAFATQARALAEDPSSTQTQEQLDRLARAANAMQQLAEVYEEQIGRVEDASLKASLHIRAAEIREEHLGDVERAIAHYKTVLEMDESHVDAASALERLYQVSERYEDLAGIYLRKAVMLPSPDEQKEYLFRAAAIFEEILERPAAAVDVYQRVLDVDPEEVRALDKLIELYLGLENWQELLRAYTRKADIVTDPDEKKLLLVEVGAVYEREIGDIDKAIDTYQRILEIAPDDVMAIGRLDALYQAAGNWQELLSVLEREADLASDPSEVIGYRYRIADLWHHKLGDAARAVEGYREILEVVPDHEPTLNALESMVSEGKEPVAAAGVLEPIYRQAGEWQKLIAVHEVQIAHEQDPVRKVELLHQVAELYEFQVEEARHAFDAFARALPLEPTHDHTLSSLERLAEPLGAWNDVTRLYDAEIERARTEAPDRVVDIALRTAQILEVQLGDVEGAIKRYGIVLAADESHVQAIESLDRLYEASERWGDLADILVREIPVAASPDDVLRLQFRLGQVYERRLGKVEGAIDQYREILSAAPEHAEALAALENLFAQGASPQVIGEILEPLYRMQEQWDRLIGVHEVQLQHQTDQGERTAMMLRVAEIAESKAQDHQKALEWAQRALLEDPLHDQVNAEAERLARMLDAWNDLANTYADVLQNTQDPSVQTAVGRRLAQTYETELGDVQRAEETYRYILSVDDKDRETLEALDRIYLAHATFDALAEVLRKRIAATEDRDELVELNYRLANVLENELGAIDDAVVIYRHIIAELDAQHADSIRALENIYTVKEDWQNLFATYEKELEVVVGDSAQSDILASMAALAADRLGDLARAVQLWRQVLDLRGEDGPALDALAGLYVRQENWRDLVDVLERAVNIADDDATRVRLYSELGRVWYERLGRERNALESWERVLDLDPSSTTALFALANIYRASQSHRELVDVLSRVIDVGAATLDDQTLEGVYIQLGELFAGPLAQPMDAVDAYRKVLEVNPKSFAALDALDAIHRAEGQWEEMVGVMERRVDALEDPEQKTEVLFSIAHMWENELGDRDKGTSAYERILELEPSSDEAFAQLDSLHREAMRWESLIEMYLSRVDTLTETGERVALLRKVAEVYEQELDDKAKAFDALQLAWSEDFTDEETGAELERVAGLTNKWNELLTVANEALQQVETPELKIAICLRCAKWYGTELGHPEYAIPYYQQILALDPANLPAMRQMADLYRATQQWPTLAQVLGRLVEMTPDAHEKMDVYVQMGELCERHLGLADQASSYYKQALELDTAHVGALEALERIFREHDQWPEYLDVLQRKASALEDPTAIIEARLQIAEAYELRLGDSERAIEVYRQVFEQDPSSLDALKGLERLYAQAERWQDLLQVLEAELEVVQTEKERILLLVRVAGMWEEEFVKPDKAAERLERVLDIDPGHEAALRGLARLYRQLQRWDVLIGTYERHVSATPDRAEKVDLYKHIGEVYARELNDPDRAIDAYLNVLNINEENIEALDALTRLYDKRGDSAAALDMMGQLARLIQEPEQIVDLRFRMGRILDEQLGDRAGAIDQYQGALDVEPGHLPSLDAMKRIHVDGGDWLQASRILEQETQYTQNARQQAKLLVELGRIYEDHLDEHARAIDSFEAAYKQDVDNEDAALPLVDEYTRGERWAEALPLLEMLVKRANKRPPEEQHRLWYLLGLAASSLGNDELAQKGFTQAHTLNPNDLPSLQGLASVHYRLTDWEKSFKYFQMILVHHRDAMTREETTDTFYRLGIIKREQNERRKALNMFDKALEEDPLHRPTLEAVVGLYEAQGEWEQVIHFKKQILEVANPDERFNLLNEIGAIWKEKLNNAQKAIQALVEANELQPKNHQVLHKLLELYNEAKLWERAVEIIQRISDLDERVSVKSKYAYTIAVILRDEVKNVDAAIEKFNEALDLDHSQLKAFEAINKILTTKKDWKGLERAFRKMLHRTVGKGNLELEFQLWHNLGVIYRDRMKMAENAADAFRMASSLQPDNLQEHQILAELYAIVPGKTNEAIDEHQYLLKQDPYRVDSYRALYKLYFDARAYDKAWCLANTLTFLKKADNEQTQFVEQYRARGMIRPQSRLDNERWIKDLFHPDDDVYVGKIFEMITPALIGIKAISDKQAGLNKKQQVDPATSTVTFAKTFGFVAQVLNLPMPRLFLVPEVQGALSYMVTAPPASVCGATLLTGFNPQDLTFLVAKHLAYYRGEHYIRRLLETTDELKAALRAALRIAGVVPADPTVDQWAQQIGKGMQPVQVEALRAISKRFVEAGGQVDIKRWMQAAELTACRAGFLVANDLDIAQRMIQLEPPGGAVDLAPKEKIKEIVLFSVSEQYFRLREALGIQIKIG